MFYGAKRKLKNIAVATKFNNTLSLGLIKL